MKLIRTVCRHHIMSVHIKTKLFRPGSPGQRQANRHWCDQYSESATCNYRLEELEKLICIKMFVVGFSFSAIFGHLSDIPMPKARCHFHIAPHSCTHNCVTTEHRVCNKVSQTVSATGQLGHSERPADGLLSKHLSRTQCPFGPIMQLMQN